MSDEGKSREKRRADIPTVVGDVMVTVEKVWATVLTDDSRPSGTLKVNSVSDVDSDVLASFLEAPIPPTSPESSVVDLDISEVIGEGGIGMVYGARQNSLDREVALKVAKQPDTSRNKGQERAFATEAVTTGKLEHPNIVPVHTMGRDEKGRIFYTMKKVQGQSWEERLSRMELDENLGVLLRVCDAVAFAHSRGIIHRDLKPENVMLGEYGEVLVLDWGLAAPVRPGSTSGIEGAPTEFGGTPAFMAPEMALNTPEKIGTRSDVYLLGGILYEIVTGRPPHRGDTSLDTICAAARNDIQPTEKKGELVDIARKAMKHEPEDRYESVGAFQKAIREYRDHAESARLTEDAEETSAVARSKSDYDRFAKAVHRFDAALLLWEQNERAREGLRKTHREYARCAYEKKDLDLALSLLDESDAEHQELREAVLEAKAERARKERALRRLKVSALSLAVLLGISLTIGFLWIRSERETALREGYFAKIGLAAQKIRDLRFDKATELLASCPPHLRHWEWGRLMRVANLALVTFKGHGDQVQSVTYLRNGNSVASAGRDGGVKTWSAESGKLLEELNGSRATVASLVTSPDGKLLAAVGEDGSLTLWNVKNGRVIRNSSDEGVCCAAFSPDGRTLACGCEGGEVRLEDVGSWEGKQVLAGTGETVGAVAYSPNGQVLAWASGPLGAAGKIHVLNATSGRSFTLEGHQDKVNCLAFAPSGTALASGGWDGLVVVWKPATGEVVHAFAAHSQAVNSVAFGPDGKWLLSASDDGTIAQWDVKAGTLLGTYKGHSGAVKDIDLSADGLRMVSASVDGTARVWDVQRGKQAVLSAAGHEGAVSAVIFSPDGTRMASGSQDGTVKVWNVETGKEILTLAAARDTVSSVDFSPDGSHLASAHWNGTVIKIGRAHV